MNSACSHGCKIREFRLEKEGHRKEGKGNPREADMRKTGLSEREDTRNRPREGTTISLSGGRGKKNVAKNLREHSGEGGGYHYYTKKS